MTFSIVATDGDSWGVAVASKFLAVGAVVPAARAGVGAIASQSFANVAYLDDGLASLIAGNGAARTLAELTKSDELREERQAGIVDAAGESATFTGSACHPWAGGTSGTGYAIQGNILTGPEVIEAMEQAWLASTPRMPLGRRLLAALAAGDEVGGDRRGRQSAALLVARAGAGYGGGNDVDADLRVDDHTAPIPELTRILGLHDLYFGVPDPDALLPLTGDLLDEVRRRLTALGHVEPDTALALGDWAGIENYEERMRPGAIDPLVLDRLRAATNGTS